VNGEFFLLAFGAALNPKLLAIDLLLARNRRPRAMFLCVLIGGISVAVTIGLIDVLVIQADVFNLWLAADNQYSGLFNGSKSFYANPKRIGSGWQITESIATIQLLGGGFPSTIARTD
jgi:membrane-associated protease RseP (regulator of RpoE activity)